MYKVQKFACLSINGIAVTLSNNAIYCKIVHNIVKIHNLGELRRQLLIRVRHNPKYAYWLSESGVHCCQFSLFDSNKT